MLIHSDYLAPTFLLTLIFVQLIFIIYFNIRSLTNYGTNQLIYLTGTDPQCQNANINALNPKNQCIVPGKTYYNEYFVQNNSNTYILGKNIKTPVSVCAVLCSNANGSINNSGQCSKNIPAYNNCLNDLAPVSGCNQASKPLAQLQVSSTQTNYYYAQNVLTDLTEC